MNEAKNPWTVVSRATAYENPWIRVEHNDVLNPAGKPGVYGVVHLRITPSASSRSMRMGT